MKTILVDKYPLCLLFLFLSFFAQGQITDDFSDGNFSENPTWEGQPANFKINTAGELQLNAPDAGTSYLSVKGNIPDSAVWKFDLRMEFAASTTNKLQIWLQADQASLASAKGYFLEIGENGSVDALKLYKSEGGAPILLASGPSGALGTDPIIASVIIKRSATGLWTGDMKTGSGQFLAQFSISDNTYAGGDNLYFGVVCIYTATRKDKFFFDNISILPDLPDTQPPVLVNASANDANSVSVTFDEPINDISGSNPLNYNISGIGQALTAVVSTTDPRQVVLTFATPFSSGTNYTLQTQNIADLQGNVSQAQSTSFLFFQAAVPGLYDILVNEIMSDPSPIVGLPEVEWIELYNPTNKYFDLQGLYINDQGGTPQPLPSYLLGPQSYVILGSSSAVAALSAYPNVLSVPNFPSLNNDGDLINLSNTASEVIDRIEFSLAWHSDDTKRAGGWTLERKNPLLPCSGADNWTSAQNTQGGTPGTQNSAFSNDPDTQGPVAQTVIPNSSTELKIIFNENLELSAENAAFYSLSPAIDVTSATFSAGKRNEIILILANPLASGTIYTINITDGVVDCSGNEVEIDDPLQIGLAEQAAAMDIVINEVLFNPVSGGYRFVELYNNSSKIFNLKDFSMGVTDDDGLVRITPILVEKLFLPGTYAVFSNNPSETNFRFFIENPEWLYQNTVPTLDDSDGNIGLYYTANGPRITVDSLSYSDDWHNGLLGGFEKEGVSLERIRFDAPTNAASNWTSAASRDGKDRGTPTAKNSQSQSTVPVVSDDLFVLPNTRFSPDDDGYEDFLEIIYNLPKAGYAATITVFDSDGVPVKKLVRQEIIGTEGTLRWDGDTDNGAKPRPGIYILFIEIFSPDGDTKKYKKTCALVERF